MNESDLIKLAKKGDRDAKQKLYLMHKKQIKGTIQKKYKNFDNNLMEELLQESSIGFLHAIKNYNPGKNTKFSSYMHFYIIAYCNRYLEKNNIIKLSITTKKKQVKYLQMVQQDKTNDEIEKELKMSISELECLFTAVYPLDMEKVNTKTSSTEDIYINGINDNLLKNALDILDPEERTIIELIYGMRGKTYNKKQISKITGIKMSAIKNIEKQAMYKLKESLLDNGYDDYK